MIYLAVQDEQERTVGAFAYSGSFSDLYYEFGENKQEIKDTVSFISKDAFKIRAFNHQVYVYPGFKVIWFKDA